MRYLHHAAITGWQSSGRRSRDRSFPGPDLRKPNCFSRPDRTPWQTVESEGARPWQWLPTGSTDWRCRGCRVLLRSRIHFRTQCGLALSCFDGAAMARS